MHDLLGDENMFLFGLHADQAAQLRREGYVAPAVWSAMTRVERCLHSLRRGFRDGVSYEDLYQRLIGSDEYLLLADYRAYCDAERGIGRDLRKPRAVELYEPSQHRPQRRFAADRAVAEYADNIWHVPHR